MKSLKKILSVLLALILCYSFCAVSLAEEDQETQPYATLRVSSNLTSSTASATGTSSENETITVSFILYSSSGTVLARGSETGVKRATATKNVTLSTGEYRIVATVSNGNTSSTRTTYFTI